MEKKQSSVEWLGLELNIIFHDITPELWEQVEVKFQQAKAMHKEEIQSAIIYAEREHNILGNVWPTQTVLDKAENYYNETFGGDNE